MDKRHGCGGVKPRVTRGGDGGGNDDDRYERLA
jgi:hypothetical protein